MKVTKVVIPHPSVAIRSLLIAKIGAFIFYCSMIDSLRELDKLYESKDLEISKKIVVTVNTRDYKQFSLCSREQNYRNMLQSR
jgi:hypothetical protein